MSGSKLSKHVEKNELSDAPLGMTVHALPLPGEVAQADEQRTHSGRWKMLALLLVCAAPVIASYFTYYVVRPEARRHYGELVTPQVDLPAASALNLQGQSVDLKSLKGQWLLVAVGSGDCKEACKENLYFQRQLREIMGKEKDRMERVWVLTDDAPVDAALLPALNHAHVLRVPPDTVKTWLSPAAGQAVEDHLYVIDPMGHFMMRFPAHMDVAGASKAKKDLDRLMRASASWDQAGR
jgi:cytochrome oxidase Cu insertion factor (SCO1/SenC/PrrC family)